MDVTLSYLINMTVLLCLSLYSLDRSSAPNTIYMRELSLIKILAAFSRPSFCVVTLCTHSRVILHGVEYATSYLYARCQDINIGYINRK